MDTEICGIYIDFISFKNAVCGLTKPENQNKK